MLWLPATPPLHPSVLLASLQLVAATGFPSVEGIPARIKGRKTGSESLPWVGRSIERDWVMEGLKKVVRPIGRARLKVTLAVSTLQPVPVFFTPTFGITGNRSWIFPYDLYSFRVSLRFNSMSFSPRCNLSSIETWSPTKRWLHRLSHWVFPSVPLHIRPSVSALSYADIPMAWFSYACEYKLAINNMTDAPIKLWPIPPTLSDITIPWTRPAFRSATAASLWINVPG